MSSTIEQTSIPTFKVGDLVNVDSPFTDWNGTAIVTTVWPDGYASVIPQSGKMMGVTGCFAPEFLTPASELDGYRVGNTVVVTTSEFAGAIDAGTVATVERVNSRYLTVRTSDGVYFPLRPNEVRPRGRFEVGDTVVVSSVVCGHGFKEGTVVRLVTPLDAFGGWQGLATTLPSGSAVTEEDWEPGVTAFVAEEELSTVGEWITPTEQPEPQPEVVPDSAMVGATVHDEEGLKALPVGTVLVSNRYKDIFQVFAHGIYGIAYDEERTSLLTGFDLRNDGLTVLYVPS